jgi:hypothetical protein
MSWMRARAFLTPTSKGVSGCSLDSPRHAGLQVERIIGVVERLSLFPESGRVVPELTERRR